MDALQSLGQYGIELRDQHRQRLSVYYDLLIEWNARFNLTAITGRDEVYSKHFADSLMGLPYMCGRVCDVGAGAGFPSIPCAIVRGGPFVLLDSVAKKVAFLATVAQQLGLDEVTAVHIRAEDAGRGVMRQTFDTVTARAVAPLPTLLEYLVPLAKVGGRIVVYKTDAQAEMALAANAIARLGVRLAEVVPYTIQDAKRVLMVFDKVQPTAAAYPRGGNKPRIQPL